MCISDSLFCGYLLLSNSECVDRNRNGGRTCAYDKRRWPANACTGIAANEYCFYRMLSILSAKRTWSRRYQAFYDAWLLYKRNRISSLLTGCHAACRSVGGAKNGFVSGKQRTINISWKVLQKGDTDGCCG